MLQVCAGQHDVADTSSTTAANAETDLHGIGTDDWDDDWDPALEQWDDWDDDRDPALEEWAAEIAESECPAGPFLHSPQQPTSEQAEVPISSSRVPPRPRSLTHPSQMAGYWLGDG